MPSTTAPTNGRRRRAAQAADQICLHWGRDRLFIQDPAWCRAVQDEATTSQPEPWHADYQHPYSRRDAEIARAGYGDIEALQRPKGLAAPQRREVASRCLEQLLGLDLPVAMLIRCSYAQPERFIALNAWLRVVCGAPAAFQVCLDFAGLQLYASGHIGRSLGLHRAQDGQVLRRALDDTWWRVSFDGATAVARTVDRRAYVHPREFYLRDGQLLDAAGAVLRTIPA